MRLGVLTQNFAGFPETGRGARACVDLAVEAERLGFDSVWVTDHVVLPGERRARYPHNDTGEFPYRWDQDIHEPLVLMGAIAQATERVEIGTAVLVIPYRHPLTTAKMIATIDQLSEGRVVLGAGVGWLQDEFDALGLPPEHFDHRGGVTVDYLRAMQRVWTSSEPAAHDGPYVRFDAVGAFPHPVRHVPVWIGGKGDRPLRRAVELGDGYLAIASDPAQLGVEVERLRRIAEDAGRDPGELTVGLIDGITLTDEPRGPDRGPLAGTTEQVAEGLAAFAEAGLDHLVAGVRTAGDPTFAGAMDAVARVAAEIPWAGL